MRYLSILALSLLLFVPAASAQARTGSWKAVQGLRPGTRIVVNVGRHIHCYFLQATDKNLECDTVRTAPGVVRFDRRIIREVRLDHGDAGNYALGVLASMGVGAGLFAVLASGSGHAGASAMIGATAGFGVGSVTGTKVPVFHGKVIYKR